MGEPIALKRTIEAVPEDEVLLVRATFPIVCEIQVPCALLDKSKGSPVGIFADLRKLISERMQADLQDPEVVADMSKHVADKMQITGVVLRGEQLIP